MPRHIPELTEIPASIDGSFVVDGTLYRMTPSGPQPSAGAGPRGEKGDVGPRGPIGPPGAGGLVVKGELEVVDDLPVQSPPGEAWVIDGELHVATELDGWLNLGSLTEGPSGQPGLDGARGPQGAPGERGEPGERGDAGTSFVLKGALGDAGDLPSGASLGDAYFVGADLWAMSDQGGWVNLGPIAQGPRGERGPKGDPGPPGAGSLLHFEGVFDPARNYSKGSIVSVGGVLWCAQTDAPAAPWEPGQVGPGDRSWQEVPLSGGTVLDPTSPDANLSDDEVWALSSSVGGGVDSWNSRPWLVLQADIPPVAQMYPSRVTLSVYCLPGGDPGNEAHYYSIMRIGDDWDPEAVTWNDPPPGLPNTLPPLDERLAISLYSYDSYSGYQPQALTPLWTFDEGAQLDKVSVALRNSHLDFGAPRAWTMPLAGLSVTPTHYLTVEYARIWARLA